MPDGISVSSGGAAVATEDVLAVAARLDEVAVGAAGIRAELSLADELVSTGVAGAPSSARGAEAELGRAVAALLLAESEARMLALALRVAAGGYTLTEEVIRRLFGTAIDRAGMNLGTFAPLLTLPLLLGGAGLALASPGTRNAFFSNPVVVKAIRAIVMGADDALLARLGIPPSIVALVGDQGLGLAGIPLVAGALAGAARGFGMLRETDVRVVGQRTNPPGGTAPSGFSERFDRIPIPAEEGGAQVLIERYEMPDGSYRFEVYVAPTADFDPRAEGQPWDMASNVSNAMGPGSGSYDAVIAAMEEAGIGKDDPVQFTGYSQGAGTAAQLVAAGGFATYGLVTFGGPTGQTPLPETVPTVIVEHNDDLVAALGGIQDNTHAVIVERWVSEETNFETSEILPGHQADGYIETASLMDVGGQPRLDDAARSLWNFTESGRLVSSVAYEIERVDS